jgi:hypothetical protein
MSDSNLPHAQRVRMDERQVLADEFFSVTGAELIPFVSDEATWYDFEYVDDAEVMAIIQSHYGVAVDGAALSLPFWQLLDLLAARRSPDRG